MAPFVEDYAVECQYRAGFSVGRPMNVPKETVCGKEGSRESWGDSPAFLEPPECILRSKVLPLILGDCPSGASEDISTG
jgi:hypothetical protein